MNQKKVHVKVGDDVQIITGHEKGKHGKVTSVNRKKNTLIIQDLNVKVKHFKSKNPNDSKGGMIKQIEGPIHISNVKKR